MKIVVAPTAMKGTLTPRQAAQAIAAGVKAWKEASTAVLCPLADGGNGFAQVILETPGARRRCSTVVGPLNKTVRAQWGLINDGRTAVIEAAEANGLHLLATEERDPFSTTTLGVGQLIDEAVRLGVEEIIIGIGGSATNDGGCGMAYALGADFGLDGAPTGGDLTDIEAVDLNGLKLRDKDLVVRAACDVTNPLYGPNGAAYIYGPQKFNPKHPATPNDLRQLDDGLSHLAIVLNAEDMAEQPGMGAAGGLGFGLAYFLNARLEPGINLVMQAVGFSQMLDGADLVITAEGAIDYQSIQGKVVGSVAAEARRRRIPVLGLAGKKGERWNECISKTGLDAVYSIADDLKVREEEAIAQAEALLTSLTKKALTEWFCD